MNQLVIFILCCNLTFSCGLKLEHWSDPIIEGSIKPNALADASRKPKLFFGVRKQNILSVFPLVDLFEFMAYLTDTLQVWQGVLKINLKNLRKSAYF